MIGVFWFATLVTALQVVARVLKTYFHANRTVFMILQQSG